MREHLEFWILPIINPDGVVAGNYRCNTQGKDMNRCFFADDDPEAKMRLTEVEILRSFMEENFSAKNKDKKAKLKMFLDVHAHSGQRDIFIYAPHTNDEDAMIKIRNFPTILD
jgi:murein tripeptide amidase MpaA